MAKKSRTYWEKRITQIEEALLNKGNAFYGEIETEYAIAIASVEKEIFKWYTRLSTNNDGLSLAEAKKMLNAKELKEFKWNVFEYIKYGEENALDGRWIKQLENASARVHISRLEAMKLQMQHQVEVLFNEHSDKFEKLAMEIYKEGFYHTAYEIQKGFNIGWDLFSLDDKRITKIISKPWAADGKNFSSRIWENKTQLVNSLYTQLSQSIIRGDSPDKAISALANEFNVSRHKAGRLVMTESAFFASASQRDCFIDLSVEKYQVVSTLDNRTSPICQDLDGEIFLMKDYEVGVTAPPFHPFCRTTTIPYFDDNYGERIARDNDGKVYYIPSNITFKEWENRYVNKAS